MLSRKIIVAFCCFLVIGMAACTNNTTPTPGTLVKEGDLIFDSVKGLAGAGNAFISEGDARLLKHNFDFFHRNRKFYDPSGNIINGSIHPLPNDDGDIPVGTAGCNDSLSRSIWFDKKVIKYLNDVLAGNGPIDGVRIYFGAYNKMGSAPGQGSARQATVFLVPTDSVQGGKHKDDYGYIDKLVRLGGLNHGELCPADCN